MYRFRKWSYVPANELENTEVYTAIENGNTFFISDTSQYVPWWLKDVEVDELAQNGLHDLSINKSLVPTKTIAENIVGTQNEIDVPWSLKDNNNFQLQQLLDLKKSLIENNEKENCPKSVEIEEKSSKKTFISNILFQFLALYLVVNIFLKTMHIFGFDLFQ